MKTWKNLIIPASILLLLIVGFVIYSFASKEAADSPETSVTSASDGYVVNYQSSDIASIHVVKKDGTGYTVSQAIASDASVVYSYASDSEDVSDYNFSQSNLSSFLSIMSSCDAIETITDAKDSLTEYGFEYPAFTVTYMLTSGEEYTLFIGNDSYDGKTVYCMLDDSGVVSTTYKIKAETCDATLIDFLDPAIMAVTAKDVASLSFKRTQDNLDIVVTGGQAASADGSSSEFGWEFQSPFKITASATFGTFIDSVLALSVTSYVDLNPGDYSKYGLDEPAYTFDFTLTNGKHMQIMLSKDMGGMYYGMSTESPAVFTLGTAVLTGLQTPLAELIDPYLDYEFIYNVKNIEAAFPEGSFSMDMDVAQGANISDEASTVMINGINAKVSDNSRRTYFALLYEAIVLINITDFDFEAKPVNTEDITITVTLKDSTQKIINLAVKDENTYYAFIDGEYVGFLVSKDEIYRDNGASLYDYGAWAAYDRLMEAIAGDDGSGIYVISDS